MRKSFDGLYLLTLNNFAKETLPGKMFIFSNKKKNKVKVLYWDNDGFAIWYKNLKKGVFSFPQSKEEIVLFSAETLQQIFNGIDIKSLKKKLRFHLDVI